MRFLSNAHTHSTFCDGKNPPEEMIRAAERLGFVSLGFSGHASQGFDWEYSMTAETQKSYLETVRALGFSLRSAPALLPSTGRQSGTITISSAMRR
mgnify:CR=1 FL=1